MNLGNIMGWKTFKDKFQLHKHIVYIENEILYIGLSILSTSIKISVKDGTFIRGFSKCVVNEDFRLLAKASNQEILDLLKVEDSFEKSITVYYVNSNFKISKTECEVFGYPNVTHDGKLMFDNLFFLEKEDAENKSLINHQSALEHYENLVKILNSELKCAKKILFDIQKNKNISNLKIKKLKNYQSALEHYENLVKNLDSELESAKSRVLDIANNENILNLKIKKSL